MARHSQEVRAGRVLAVLSAAGFMASLDVFIVNVAFGAIGRDLHGAISDLSWVLNAYAIVYAALLVPLGRLSDRYGRKAGFLAGLALFTAASAACAASAELWQLVLFRVLQAVGAAALTPTSLGLLLSATEPDRRVRVVRIWAAWGAVAAALGPVLGGLLVQASWRWVFIVNVPVGLIALAAAVSVVPDSREGAVSRVPDLLGSLVLALAIGALTLALVKGTEWGWTSGETLLSFGLAAAGIAVVAYRIGHHASPVVEPALLRAGAFVWANVTGLLFSIGFAAGLLGTILWMQNVWHYGPLQSGLAVAPGPLMVPLLAAASQRVAHRIPASAIASAGCLVFAAGTVLRVVSVGTTPHYLTEMLPSWLLTGAGVGMALPTILAAATASLPASRTATGSAVVNMSRQIGASLGVSMLVAILAAATPTLAGAETAYRLGWWAVALASLAAALTALGMTRTLVRPAAPAPAPAVAVGGAPPEH
jgi:EmrB/QacA subfamily drug resistance transporter